jgi:2-polyprenyl-3-methyl-5-hydroxy-6-metoxy-1,4-benzoquinol methylase
LNKIEERKQYFNRYWETRDLPSADARSEQRADLVLSLLDSPGDGELLDVGCGRGAVMKQLSQHGYKISGCDLASESISKLKNDGLDVFICDIETDPLPQKYDNILCFEVLQQLYDPAKVIRKFVASMNQNGSLIISIPNEFHIISRIKLFFGVSHLGHFEESHIRLFTPGRAEELFDHIGLRIEKVISVSIVPPRFGLLSLVGMSLAGIWPGLFSLSQIYKLRVR